MPTNHAILAPSASKRWMVCAPSARAESGIPSKDTSFSKEGTLAHSCAEFMFYFYLQHCELIDWKDFLFSVESHPDWVFFSKEAESLGIDLIEMGQTVHDYYVKPVFEDFLVARANDPEAQLLVEAELKLTQFIPEGFGSSDAVIISGQTLHVYDLKYGKGVKVEAEHNTQMLCYAIGAAMGVGELYAIRDVKMTILQPRLQHESTWAVTWDYLYWWANDILKPAAEKAFSGEGEYVPGDHCQFCRFAPRCRASWVRAKVVSELYAQPEETTEEELSVILPMLDSIRNWTNKVEEYALQRMLNGNGIKGWKVVEGRSIRKITDPKAAYAALIGANFEPDMIMKEPELKTLGELEKMLGKVGKEIIAPFITKPAGKPTIAPISDKRPAIANAKEDFKDTIC